MNHPAVGDTVPPFARRTSFDNWNRFAAVNDEFIPIHMDDEAGRRAGNPDGAFGMGNLRLSYLMNMLRDWCDDDGEVRVIEVHFRELNQKYDVLTAVGEVTAVEECQNELRVELSVDVVNQRGLSTAPGRATVVFPLSRRPTPNSPPGPSA